MNKYNENLSFIKNKLKDEKLSSEEKLEIENSIKKIEEAFTKATLYDAIASKNIKDMPDNIENLDFITRCWVMIDNAFGDSTHCYRLLPAPIDYYLLYKENLLLKNKSGLREILEEKIKDLYRGYVCLYNQSTETNAKNIYKAKMIAIGEVMDILKLSFEPDQSIEELLEEIND